jgi:hypothetical protein
LLWSQFTVDALADAPHFFLCLRSDRLPEVSHPLLAVLQDGVNPAALFRRKVQFGAHAPQQVHALGQAPSGGRARRQARLAALALEQEARANRPRDRAGQEDHQGRKDGFPKVHGSSPVVSRAA